MAGDGSGMARVLGARAERGGVAPQPIDRENVRPHLCHRADHHGNLSGRATWRRIANTSGIGVDVGDELEHDTATLGGADIDGQRQHGSGSNHARQSRGQDFMLELRPRPRESSSASSSARLTGRKGCAARCDRAWSRTTRSTSPTRWWSWITARRPTRGIWSDGFQGTGRTSSGISAMCEPTSPMLETPASRLPRDTASPSWMTTWPLRPAGSAPRMHRCNARALTCCSAGSFPSSRMVPVGGIAAGSRALVWRDLALPDGAVIPPKRDGHIPHAGTDNCVFQRATTIDGPAPFNPAFGRIGGEDTDLLQRLDQRGAMAVFSKQAWMIEFIPAHRNTPEYLARRSYHTSQQFVRIAAQNGARKRLTACRHMTTGLVQLALAIVRYGAAKMVGADPVWARIAAAAAAGKLLWTRCDPTARHTDEEVSPLGENNGPESVGGARIECMRRTAAGPLTEVARAGDSTARIGDLWSPEAERALPRQAIAVALVRGLGLVLAFMTEYRPSATSGAGRLWDLQLCDQRSGHSPNILDLRA